MYGCIATHWILQNFLDNEEDSTILNVICIQDVSSLIEYLHLHFTIDRMLTQLGQLHPMYPIHDEFLTTWTFRSCSQWLKLQIIRSKRFSFFLIDAPQVDCRSWKRMAYNNNCTWDLIERVLKPENKGGRWRLMPNWWKKKNCMNCFPQDKR